MIKVLRHGGRISIQNPITQAWQEAVNVVFIEEGRNGANDALSNGSNLLTQAVGVETGLANLRIHTQSVLTSAIKEFPVGKEISSLFINRKLYSTPQMRQQVDVEARMVDGKPTYFTTYVDNKQQPDIDLRLDNNVLVTVNPGALIGARVGAAEVRVISSAQSLEPVEQP